MSSDTYHKRKVGNRVLQPETQMMGYGFDPALSEGSLKPPIFLTSTFVFRSAQDGKDFFDYTSGRRAPPPGKSRGPGVFALQQSESRSARGPARVVGGRRERRRVLERHVGDLDHAVGVSQAQRLPADEPAAVRRHRDAHRSHAAGVRYRRGRRAGRHQSATPSWPARRPRWTRRRRKGGRVGLLVTETPGQSHQWPGGSETVARGCRSGLRGQQGGLVRRSRWTTPTWGPCTRSRWSTARTW